MSIVNSQHLHIIKIEVAHGSDRHEISLYSPNEPTVHDLLVELEKKTRVPISNIQIIFKGQKLHMAPQGALKGFGIFSGSRLLMVGERLSAPQDAVFRRVIGINKDVGLVEKGIQEVSNEFALVQSGGLERSMIKEYLPQMHQRIHGMKRDLETFKRVLSELGRADNAANSDVDRYWNETENKINDNITKCDKIIDGIANHSK